MNRRSCTTWASSLSAALVISLFGCGQRNVDTFNGVVDPSNFDAFHTPVLDADNDDVIETLPPREGYIDGQVVQFFDFGPAPVFLTEIEPGVLAFVTEPALLFRFSGSCEPGRQVAPLDDPEEPDFDFDPRFSFFSPNRQHDIIDVLPDGSDNNGDDIPDYNPIFQVVDVAMPAGYTCNEVINVDTLRLRFGTEDINGNGVLDTGEDLDADAQIDDDLGGDLTANFGGNQFVMVEALDSFTKLPDLVTFPFPDPSSEFGPNVGFERFDLDGFSEDLDFDLKLDPETEFDTDGDGDFEDEDFDLDGNFDNADEDLDGDGQLDANEDIDGDNRLDFNEDFDGNGSFDIEDLDHDGFQDCGEVLVQDCVAGATPITEDLNGDGILQLGEDGSTIEFGAPNGVLDTEDRNNDGILQLTEDLDGDGALTGGLGGIPAYDDDLIVFFKAAMLHIAPFRPPTITEVDVIVLDGDGNPVNAGKAKTVETMRVFIDEDDPDARPIFEFAPGDVGFQPLVQVVTYVRPAGFLAGELNSLQQLEDENVVLTETETVLHAAFIVTNNDPTILGDSVIFDDADLDGLTDFIETVILGTDPEDTDTDGDGILDGAEDRTLDGNLEPFESDPLSADGDGDTILDAIELQDGTDPLSDDTDEDTLLDQLEAGVNADPLNPDTDGDGLLDGEEVNVLGTDPDNDNSDGDCSLDGTEVEDGSDPADPDSPIVGGGQLQCTPT